MAPPAEGLASPLSIALVFVVFATVHLGMAIGRWPELKVGRAGMALLGSDAAITGATVLAASQVRSDPLSIAGVVQKRGAASMNADRVGELG